MFIIKYGEKFFDGNQWADEYPEAEIWDEQEEAERVCANIGGVVIENYGYVDERIVFDSECDILV